MAVELQIRSQTFASMVARMLQRAQRTTCLPPVNGIYLDRVEPVPDAARWSEAGSEAVELRMPLDVFVVRRDELLAAPNAVPAGATRAAGRVELLIRVAITDGALVLTVRDVDLGLAGGMLGAAAGTVRDQALAASAADMRVDVAALLRGLGIDTGSGGAVVLTGDLVVASFGTPGASPAPVGHDFGWALFLDAAATEELVKTRLPERLPPLQGLTRGARWAPDGTTAVIEGSVHGTVDVPDPFTCSVDASLRCVVSTSAGVPELRIDATYDVEVDTGAVPFVDRTIETVAKAAINPAAFGAVRTGDDSFAMTLALPQIVVGTEVWRYDGLVAGPAGLVIGGTTSLPVDLSQVVLTVDTHPFSGGAFAALFCSRGDLQTEQARADLFATVAYVDYDGASVLCDVEVIPAGLEAHLTLPKAGVLTGGVRPGKGTILMAFGAQSANAVDEPVKLIVRSPRGVRCCDLGIPQHFAINPDGTVQDGVVVYFDDCNRLPPNFDDMTPEEYEQWSGLIWYTYWGLVPGKDYDPEKPPIFPETVADVPAQWDDTAGVPELTLTGTDAGTRLITGVPGYNAIGTESARTGPSVTRTGE